MNFVHTANGDHLLLSQYSNKIYKINDYNLHTEIENLMKVGDSNLTKKLCSIGIECPDKKEISRFDFHPEIEIILTYNCNLSCDYCWQRKTDFDRKRGMDKATFKNVVKYIKKNNESFTGTYNIGYMGGEPLLMFDFIKWSQSYLTEHLSKKLDIRILTNGTILTKEMCDFFNENNITIIISLDGPENINKRRGNFNKIINGINLLIENNIFPKIQSTLNVNDFVNGSGLETAIFFLDLNLKNFSLMFEGPLQTYDETLLYDSYIDILKYALEWTSSKKKVPLILKEFLLFIISPEANITHCFCRFLYPKGFQIAPNGDIFACEFNRSKMAYGNVNNDNDLPIISSHPLAYTTSKYSNALCVNCVYAGICDGYPLLCSLYKDSMLCPKQQYFKACFDVVYPQIKYLLSILREEEK